MKPSIRPMTTLRAALALLAVGLLAACGAKTTGSEIRPEPVGVGSGVNELKGTPCACAEIEMTIPYFEPDRDRKNSR